jgi:ElaB/YqjD/DUF883 family membrane-anchored ribosome-binding protein
MSTRTTPYEPNFGSKLSETATEMKDKVSELGRTAADKIEESRVAAANKIEKTATEAKGMASDVQGMIRRNPGPVVLAAGVIGFLVGQAVTNRQNRRRRSMQNAKAALVAAAATHFKEIVGVVFPRLQQLSQRAAQRAKAAV